MPKHDFFEFLNEIKESMAQEYTHIRSRAVDDPGTAGDQSEISWAQFLRGWLPPMYPVVTKGRILFPDGTASPQIDLVVLHPSYPEHLRDKKYYFSGGIIAAFECKLTLKKQHLRDAFSTAAQIKRKVSATTDSPFDELNRLPYYGLLAHSQVWKGELPAFKLYNRIQELQLEEAELPHELMDIVCVADTATVKLVKDVEIGSNIHPVVREELDELGMDEAVTTMYLSQDETGHKDFPHLDRRGEILAALLFSVIQRIGFEDASVRPWANHIAELGAFGGIGQATYWRTDVLSSEVRARIKSLPEVEDYWNRWALRRSDFC